MASLNDIETKVQSIIDILKSRIVKTITGILPLTFTANAGNAVDWIISGNDDNGTVQLIDKSMFTDGKGISPGGNVVDNSKRTSTVDSIDVSDITSAYLSFISTKNVVAVVATYDSNDTLLIRQTGVGSGAVLNLANADRLRITLYEAAEAGVVIADITQISLTIGSTAPDHYIPYQKGVGEQRQDGYYVPLTISQTGQTDKNYDIYIGDTPLTDGQSISKTSTGVDIELFEGENIVSTTLYNKPEMTIKYKYNGGN